MNGRAAMLPFLAIALVALVACGDRAGGLASAAAPSDVRSASPTARALSPTLESRLATVRAELAGHPSWPQREVTMQGEFLLLPYGARDPQSYFDWLDALGWRYDAMVRWDYVAMPGAPSLVELDTIQHLVDHDLQAMKANLGYSVVAVSERGRVELTYEATGNTDFLAVVAGEQQKYGDKFYAEATNDPPLPAAGHMSTATPAPRE